MAYSPSLDPPTSFILVDWATPVKIRTEPLEFSLAQMDGLWHQAYQYSPIVLEQLRSDTAKVRRMRAEVGEVTRREDRRFVMRWYVRMYDECTAMRRVSFAVFF